MSAPKVTVGVRLDQVDVETIDRLAKKREMTRSAWLALLVQRGIAGAKDAKRVVEPRLKGKP